MCLPISPNVAPGDVDVLRAMARGETRAAEFSVGVGEEREIGRASCRERV